METRAIDRVWYRFLVATSSVSEAVAKNALVEAGLEACHFNSASSDSHGIVFFDRVDLATCDFAREASADGMKRVLGVSVSRSRLAPASSWSMLRAGCSDVFAWHGSASPGREIATRFARWRAIDEQLVSRAARKRLVGASPAWLRVLRQVIEVGLFTEAPVLIMGETGTGKELVAGLIHEIDRRKDKGDFVVVDCGAIVPELSGSEFFGHERGAFTGAFSARDGAFALADRGTLFLDEIGELPASLQPQLLRVVQEGTFKRVGGNHWNRTAFRLVCATNRDLVEAARNGAFRHDLYYRIAGFVCRLPPLRERAEDIMLLALHFLDELRPGQGAEGFDDAVREYLLKRDYAGNVRDLRQLVARMAYCHAGAGPLTAGDIPRDEWRDDVGSSADWRDAGFSDAIRRALAFGNGLREIGRAAEDAAIRIALTQSDGSLQLAARKLGVTDRALQMRRAARRQADTGVSFAGALPSATRNAPPPTKDR